MRFLGTANPSPRRGFSLIEILIVVAIAIILVVTVGNITNNTGLLKGLVSVELQSKSDVTQTLGIMENEIRSAADSQSGAYPLDAASTSSFAFYSDVNGDGLTEHVRYFLASSSVMRGVIRPSGTPATYPTSSEVVTDEIDDITVASATPLFTYYDTNYTGTQAPLASPIVVSEIRLVGINFTVVVHPSSGPASIETFSKLIDIRNLRSN